jgi:hypothetical protein
MEVGGRTSKHLHHDGAACSAHSAIRSQLWALASNSIRSFSAETVRALSRHFSARCRYSSTVLFWRVLRITSYTVVADSTYDCGLKFQRPPRAMDQLILKRASASRPSGEWNDDDFDVPADGAVVGRIFKANAAPVGTPWMWTLAFGQHEDRTPTHGYAESREAAMAAFAKSWRRK